MRHAITNLTTLTLLDVLDFLESSTQTAPLTQTTRQTGTHWSYVMHCPRDLTFKKFLFFSVIQLVLQQTFLSISARISISSIPRIGFVE